MPTSRSAWSSDASAAARASRMRTDLAQVSRRRLHRRQPVRAAAAAGRAGHRAVAIGRAGPQEGVARDFAARAVTAAGRAAALLSIDEVLRGSAANLASRSRPCGCRTRSPASMSTSPPTMRWSKRSWRAEHDRPCDLRHGPDGHPPRDLHAVPAALRDAARAVAAAVPAARDRCRCWPMSARLIDRARLKEINHRLLLGGKIHPRDLKPLVESFAEQAGRDEHPAGRAQGDRARQGRRPPRWSWRRLPTGFTPTPSPSGWASTTSSAPARSSASTSGSTPRSTARIATARRSCG